MSVPGGSRAALLGLALLAAAAVTATGCLRSRKPIGIELRTTARFDAELGRYKSFGLHKSLAFAGDPEAVYVFGYAHERTDRDGAVAEALADCEARRRDRRIADSCRTIAIDDERIEGSPSPGF